MQGHAVFGPEAIGRLQRRHGVEPCERRRRIGGDERLADLQEVAGLGDLGCVIGVLPAPDGAFVVSQELNDIIVAQFFRHNSFEHVKAIACGEYHVSQH